MELFSTKWRREVKLKGGLPAMPLLHRQRMRELAQVTHLVWTKRQQLNAEKQ